MKIFKRITVFFAILILLSTNFVFANELVDVIKGIEVSDEYQRWLDLSDEEKEKLKIIPRSNHILKTQIKSENPIKATQKVGSSSISKFDLRDIIPENLTIKDQGKNGTCWAFAASAVLESTLALDNYHNSRTTKTYDFSEMHMLYATTRILKNGEINKYGLSKGLTDGANLLTSRGYYAAQIGPVKDSDMVYTSDPTLVSVSEVFSKEVVARVYDTIEFPTYDVKTEDITDIKNAIKEHIKTYGGVETAIYGAELFSDVYNNETGALYTNDSDNYPVDHDVTLIGWDDNYSRDNFNESMRPSKDGAWICKNSWGEKYPIEKSFFQNKIFSIATPEDLAQLNWTSPSDVTDDAIDYFFTDSVYKKDTDGSWYLPIGDHGYMYISYEDANLYSSMSGVLKASENLNYDHLYQYDLTVPGVDLTLTTPKAYMAQIFEKESNDEEYINEIGITLSETTYCQVFINPNNDSLATSNFIKAKLKDGEYEVNEAGYHTIELAEPVKIEGNKFAIIVYIQGTRNEGILIPIESHIDGDTLTDDLDLEKGKCFWTTPSLISSNQWADFGDMTTLTSGRLPNGDSSLKVFTLNKENLPTGSTEPTPTPTPTPSTKPTPTPTPEDPNAPIGISFSNPEANVNMAKGYYFTDTSKQDYMIVDLTVNGLTRSLKNNNYEYYYYLSTSANEKNISEWVKDTDTQTSENSLSFYIDTRNLSNYNELLKGNTLYLYIKEVVRKGNNEKITLSPSIKVVNKGTTEVYKDNVKQQDNNVTNNTQGESNNKGTSNNNSNNTDTTTANKILPKTGAALVIIVLIVTTSVVGIVIYRKYKNMDF